VFDNIRSTSADLQVNVDAVYGSSANALKVTGTGTAGRLGVDLGAVNGQTLSMQNNAIAVAVKDNTANRYATVSTSSSLQTVVSATVDEETDPDSPVEVVKKKRSKSVSLSGPMMGTVLAPLGPVLSGVKK